MAKSKKAAPKKKATTKKATKKPTKLGGNPNRG
jgi:hypothetical protein